MKKYILMLVAMAGMSMSAWAGAASGPEDKNAMQLSYKDKGATPFVSLVSSQPRFVFSEDGKDITIYRNGKEEAEIGAMKVESITYVHHEHSYGERGTQRYTCTCGEIDLIRQFNAMYADLAEIEVIEYHPICKSRIDAAREAYDALSEEQKALIPEAQYKVLTDAEETYKNLTPIWGEWAQTTTASYNYVKYWNGTATELTVNVRYATNVENMAQVQVVNWGNKEPGTLTFVWNTQTNTCFVPAQILTVNPSYGDVTCSDIPIWQDNLRFYKSYPCTYDPETMTFTLNVAYYVSLGGFGFGPETLVFDEPLRDIVYYKSTLAITDAKWATFVAPYAVTLPEGVTAYKVEGKDDNNATLVMEEVEGKLPANTPVVVYSETPVEKEYNRAIVEGIPQEGIMVGVLVNTDIRSGYVLQNQNGLVGFYQVNGIKTVPANRAYIAQSASTEGIDDERVKAYFFDTATALKALNALTDGKAEIYDLNGRKQSSLQKGINIVNGVKVLVK